MTELVWDGKHDENGGKVAATRIVLPFQTVETVNESAADRDRMQDLFASGRPTDWRNRLIWGDKKYVLPSLLAESLRALAWSGRREASIFRRGLTNLARHSGVQ